MAQLANLYGIISETTSIIVPKSQHTITRKPHFCRATVVLPRTTICCWSSNDEALQSNPSSSSSSSFNPETRRVALSQLAVASSLGVLSRDKSVSSLAEEVNKWWIDGPLPVPLVDNKIANEATGTRSFLTLGLYVSDASTKGRIVRLRKNAFDLSAMGDLIRPDMWPYVRRYLRLKSTYIYYDFDKVISAAEDADKQALTDLANRLFDSLEEVLDAVKVRDLQMTQSSFQDSAVILQEVIDRMA